MGRVITARDIIDQQPNNDEVAIFIGDLIKEAIHQDKFGIKDFRWLTNIQSVKIRKELIESLSLNIDNPAFLDN